MVRTTVRDREPQRPAGGDKRNSVCAVKGEWWLEGPWSRASETAPEPRALQPTEALGWCCHLEMLRASPFPLPLPLLPPSLRLSSRSWPQLRCLGSEERDGPRSLPAPDKCCVPCAGHPWGGTLKKSPEGGHGRSQGPDLPLLSGRQGSVTGCPLQGCQGPSRLTQLETARPSRPSPPPRPLPRVHRVLQTRSRWNGTVLSRGRRKEELAASPNTGVAASEGGPPLWPESRGGHIPEPLILEPSGQRGHSGS